MNIKKGLTRLLLVGFLIGFSFEEALGQAKAFGTELPVGVESQAIIKLMTPDIDPSLVTLVGMKKWPHRPNTYLAIVCAARSRADFSNDSLYAGGVPCCNAGYGGVQESETPKLVYLSMLEYTDDLKLIASYPGMLDVKTCWKHSNMEAPNYESEDFLNPGSYDRFDFAKYKISDDQIAFGIRVGWRNMYAGGGGYFQALMLFMVQGSTIVNVLSEPISEEGMSSGEWNADGTRSKNIWETNNIVIMLPSKTSGFYDIKMKELKGKWSQRFKWHAGDRRYKAVQAN